MINSKPRLLFRASPDRTLRPLLLLFLEKLYKSPQKTTHLAPWLQPPAKISVKRTKKNLLTPPPTVFSTSFLVFGVKPSFDRRTSSSCRRSNRQSGPADRQPVLPEPPAAQSSHGGRVWPHQPAAAAQLPGGVAAGPHRVGDEKRRRRVPAAAAQGGVRCVAVIPTNPLEDQVQSEVLTATPPPTSSGLLYYAGHGYENYGNSFMVPVDAPNPYRSANCLCVQSILKLMQEKETGLNVFLLDMCRKRWVALCPHCVIKFSSFTTLGCTWTTQNWIHRQNTRDKLFSFLQKKKVKCSSSSFQGTFMMTACQTLSWESRPTSSSATQRTFCCRCTWLHLCTREHVPHLLLLKKIKHFTCFPCGCEGAKTLRPSSWAPAASPTECLSSFWRSGCLTMRRSPWCWTESQKVRTWRIRPGSVPVRYFKWV